MRCLLITICAPEEFATNSFSQTRTFTEGVEVLVQNFHSNARADEHTPGGCTKVLGSGLQ